MILAKIPIPDRLLAGMALLKLLQIIGDNEEAQHCINELSRIIIYSHRWEWNKLSIYNDFLDRCKAWQACNEDCPLIKNLEKDINCDAAALSEEEIMMCECPYCGDRGEEECPKEKLKADIEVQLGTIRDLKEHTEQLARWLMVTIRKRNALKKELTREKDEAIITTSDMSMMEIEENFISVNYLLKEIGKLKIGDNVGANGYHPNTMIDIVLRKIRETAGEK